MIFLKHFIYDDRFNNKNLHKYIQYRIYKMSINQGNKGNNNLINLGYRYIQNNYTTCMLKLKRKLGEVGGFN